ncbi:MAG: PIN domain nuclease of toxin-antitoxin system [Hyphomicrobiaceae bacterium]|jgi:PIN domain nuclease of toxin-antitoxin system
MLNLDTHILIHALCGSATRREARLLSENQWGISAIVLWELATLSQLGRIELNLDDARFRLVLTRIHVWPLTVEVCRTSCALDISSDPADELIAATSVVHHLPLLTRDKKLRRSKQVPLA